MSETIHSRALKTKEMAMKKEDLSKQIEEKQVLQTNTCCIVLLLSVRSTHHMCSGYFYMKSLVKQSHSKRAVHKTRGTSDNESRTEIYRICKRASIAKI